MPPFHKIFGRSYSIIDEQREYELFMNYYNKAVHGITKNNKINQNINNFLPLIPKLKNKCPKCNFKLKKVNCGRDYFKITGICVPFSKFKQGLYCIKHPRKHIIRDYKGIYFNI